VKKIESSSDDNMFNENHQLGDLLKEMCENVDITVNNQHHIFTLLY